MSIEESLRALEEQLEPLDRTIRLLTASLDAPRLRKSVEWHGYRYDAPRVMHFCLIKLVSAVSAFSAAIKLARDGYLQEVAVLMRTLVECTTHIEFVLEPFSSEEHRKIAETYVQEFFEDGERGAGAEVRKAQVPQGKVHEALGKTLDDIAAAMGDPKDRKSAVALYRDIYRTYSNYVHAKYPECMDLYGGRPGQFHTHGMAGTPKEPEAVEVLETFIGTLSNALIMMIQSLGLGRIVAADPVIKTWYDDRHERQ
jgi:hypothetical protein